ncbi:hypothetical protein KRP22_006345 [Phytophthora ramorum]|nr:hypothetical protein KRP22_2522 [Phytophthora ramorum]
MAPPELPVMPDDDSDEPELLWAVADASELLESEAELETLADKSDEADSDADDVAFEDPEEESDTAALVLELPDETCDDEAEDEDEPTAVDEELDVVEPETLETANTATSTNCSTFMVLTTCLMSFSRLTSKMLRPFVGWIAQEPRHAESPTAEFTSDWSLYARRCARIVSLRRHVVSTLAHWILAAPSL